MKLRALGTSKLAAVAVSLALVGGACGGDGSGDGDAAGDVEKTVRASLAAENAKDVEAFLALWTDNGLEQYDVGSRDELEAGDAEGFGADKIEIVRFSDTTVDGDAASTVVDASPAEAEVARALYRVTFELVKKGDGWLLDGFEFNGSPPAAEGTTVVDIKAQEYAFVLSASDAPTDVAFTFDNVGKEQHELTLYKAPAGTDIATAKAALENVDGSELDDIPDGYQVDHVSFAEAGEKVGVTFAEELEPGTYFFTCYIPAGGFGEEGPVNPDGKPHIQLGMISAFTIK